MCFNPLSRCFIRRAALHIYVIERWKSILLTMNFQKAHVYKKHEQKIIYGERERAPYDDTRAKSRFMYTSDRIRYRERQQTHPNGTKYVTTKSTTHTNKHRT